MSNALEIRKKLAEPKQLKEIELALGGSGITPEKFARVAITAMNTNQDIGMCSIPSVINSLLKCAADGLLPDGREAALVKYGNVAQYMPMVYGLIKRMKNSGEISTVNAHIVYENDEFDFEIVDGVESFKHKPKLFGERGNIILAYAVVSLRDGGKHIEVMTKADIDKVRASSKSKDGPAWKNWYDEMAKKSVIHRAAKRVPTSSDIAGLMANDAKIIMGKEDDEENKEPSLIDTLNEAIDAEIIEQQPTTDIIGE